MGESVTHTHLVFVPFPCTELLNPQNLQSDKDANEMALGRRSWTVPGWGLVPERASLIRVGTIGLIAQRLGEGPGFELSPMPKDL